MYKILIADDEHIVIESLTFIIRSSFEGECELASAKSGRQAIELAESFRPDIVIMDIHMPGINGLKAMEEILRVSSRIRFLILTAYSNFEYAKEALRLGAVNYLTKPVNRAALVEQLSAVMRAIDQEREQRQEALSIQEKMEVVMPILENSFVVSLIMGGGDGGEAYRRLLGVEAPYGVAMVIEWGEGRQPEGMGNPVGAAVRAHKLLSPLMETVRIYFKSYLSGVMGNKLIAVLPAQETPTPYEERLSIIERAIAMTGALGDVLSADVRVGIGPARPWERMEQSYQEALTALRQGRRTVTHADDLHTGDETQDAERMERALMEALRWGLSAQAGQEASVYALWLLRRGDPEAARLRLVETAALALRLLRGSGGAPEGNEAVSSLLTCEGEEALRGAFVSLMERIAAQMCVPHDTPDGPIARAQAYIREGFARPITLSQVARQVNISPYYFSKLFKEETGQNFSDYLTAVRIDAAKRLLARMDYPIKQICVESGFANPNYFSRIFKKCTGLTPTEFRDALHG